MKHWKPWVIVSLLAVLAVATVIFLFSAQSADASSALSRGIAEKLIALFVPGYGDLTAARQREILLVWGKALRKTAHFAEYALLGVTLTLFVRLRWRAWSWKKVMLIAWIAATVYAGTDELHQLFVSERGPGVLDVCLDSVGALAGIQAMSRLLRRREARKKGNASAMQSGL